MNSPFNFRQDSIDKVDDWSVYCLLVVTSKTMNREGEEFDQRSKMKSDSKLHNLPCREADESMDSRIEFSVQFQTRQY